MAFKRQQQGEREPFPNNGRGVFIYTNKIPSNRFLEIVFTGTQLNDGASPEEENMTLTIKGDGYFMTVGNSGRCLTPRWPEGSKQEESKQEESGRLVKNSMASYWISIDRDSFVIKYGIGYLMKETTCATYELKESKNTSSFLQQLFDPNKLLYVTVYMTAQDPPLSQSLIDAEPAFQFKNRPLASNFPPLVKDSSTATLLDLNKGWFTFSADLPAACQQMYQTMKGCDLECSGISNIQLSDAIRYSINTKGKFLNDIIERKKKDRGGFFKEGYIHLRVALGNDMGNGHSIPYVMELWPSGNKNLVHNHGGACTVIKILFGQIKFRIYNKLTDPPGDKVEPLTSFDAKQGDFTWMDENWYQTHQMENTSDDFCATLLSYRYGSDDKMQWPGFDYIKGDNSDEMGVVYPGSDTDFTRMRDAVLEEYAAYLEEEKGTKTIPKVQDNFGSI